jgi:hypothetical protein
MNPTQDPSAIAYFNAFQPPSFHWESMNSLIDIHIHGMEWPMQVGAIKQAPARLNITFRQCIMEDRVQVFHTQRRRLEPLGIVEFLG